ncbi:MAG: anhydro-N-acetylmuramic acid kinase [Flavobacteriales bacterium]|nr:MAG: anhydro-N-acetylmuramic acid kinase [Flavobacteriales bacterium]
MSRYNVIGTMSGTSLDGLDIAYCSFNFLDNHWTFKINSSITVGYTQELKQKLSTAIQMSGFELMQLHNEFGNFIGHSINNFISNEKIKLNNIDAISSHGHTIFHQPEIKLTTQIGNGANASGITNLPIICNFRSSDIALGGQGAPLVPIGDKLLFSEYDYCINLGGIANISFEEDKQRIAFDICPANIVLNKLSQELGKSFDENGELAQSGKIDTDLLNNLNKLNYYQKSNPKSLGIEWVENEVFPIINSSRISAKDKLSTLVEHIAIQISNSITSKNKKVLLSGGGTFNSFLIERIKTNTSNEIIIPSMQIIDFKEALIFAFLGVLRLRNEVNCLQSVTGAQRDNIGGCIYQSF